MGVPLYPKKWNEIFTDTDGWFNNPSQEDPEAEATTLARAESVAHGIKYILLLLMLLYGVANIYHGLSTDAAESRRLRLDPYAVRGERDALPQAFRGLVTLLSIVPTLYLSDGILDLFSSKNKLFTFFTYI